MHNSQEDTRFSNALPSAIFSEMKRCARWGCVKLVSEFNVSKKKPDGRQPYCRACQEDDHLLRRYHMTRQERDLMYAHQQGQCASCHALHSPLYVYAFEGIGVMSLVCPRCMRVLNGFNRNPAIVESAIAYLDYFGAKALYGVARRVNEDWEALPTGEPPRKTRGRHYPRGVNPETYEHWSLLNNHLCYICWEPCPTGRDLAKDHQHVTDCNRGLLCFSCNTTLGTAKEDIDLLDACATFLTSYLAPYIAGFVWITDEMIADAAHEVHWESGAYSFVLPMSPQE